LVLWATFAKNITGFAQIAQNPGPWGKYLEILCELIFPLNMFSSDCSGLDFFRFFYQE